jgi:hypothetical protein
MSIIVLLEISKCGGEGEQKRRQRVCLRRHPRKHDSCRIRWLEDIRAEIPEDIAIFILRSRAQILQLSPMMTRVGCERAGTHPQIQRGRALALLELEIRKEAEGTRNFTN